MITLLMDTAHERGYLAIGRDGELLVEHHLSADRRHSDTFAARVATLLKEVGVAPQDVDRMGVGVGPGSYTGVRVAVAFAKGFGVAVQAPLVGFGSLEPYLAGAPPNSAALFDARAGGVYLLLQGGSPERCSIQDLPKRLAGVELVVTPDLSIQDRLLEPLDCRWVEGVIDGRRLLRQVEARDSNRAEIIYLSAGVRS